ncbi:MAG: hypothetical protein WCZ29_15385 [Mycolicibacterium vanbaalenii]|uniref:hypothetical protein n=1 Tax=Mycolicibacterium vanbaalenii TaxID=110539 RepID=UPI003565E3FC
MLGFALLYALAQHVVLANVPERFPGGARLGDLIYDLSIAYAGAFVFYLLVVRIPLRRDRKNHDGHLGWLIWLIVEHAKSLMVTLNRAADIEPADRPNTWANVDELCRKIGPNSPAPQDQGVELTRTGIKSVTVLFVILDRMGRTETCIKEILGFSTAVPSELVDLLTAIQRHSHFLSFHSLASMAERYPGLGFGVSNPDLMIWRRQLFDYLLIVDRLDKYAQDFGLGDSPPQRPGWLTADGAEASTEVPLKRLMYGGTEGVTLTRLDRLMWGVNGRTGRTPS